MIEIRPISIAINLVATKKIWSLYPMATKNNLVTTRYDD
jgi:hypothetical protein